MAKILPAFFLSTLQLCISRSYSCTPDQTAPLVLSGGLVAIMKVAALFLTNFQRKASVLWVPVLIPVPLARKKNVWDCVAPPATAGSGHVETAAITLVVMIMIGVVGKSSSAPSACFLLSFDVKSTINVS